MCAAGLAILLFLLLPAHSAAAAPAAADDAVAAAVAWLHTQQRPDGGFGQPAASASATADVIYVLALIGENPDGLAWTPAGGQSALRALAALAPGYVQADAGQAGKVARAVALAGGDPRSFGGLDLIAIIQRAYDPGTGRYHPALLYRHTLAVEGLLRAGETPPPAALQTLLNAQLADGGWFWSFDAEQSDVDSTGRVLQVLAGQAGVRDAAALGRAAGFLCRQQLSSGGWNVGNQDGPANANSTALAIGGLRAAGYDPQGRAFRRAGRGAVDTLAAFQEPGGGFVYVRAPGKEESRLMATIDALNALAQPLVRFKLEAAPAIARAVPIPNRWPARLEDWSCYRLR
jgi:hypothetical protein